MISLTCGTEYMTQVSLSMKQKQAHRHREQTCQGRERGRDGLGVWDQQMQTIARRMDKQQSPTVYYRGLYLK